MSDLSEFVTLNETTLTTDSRRVAKHFHKRHDTVLRAFDRMDCDEEFRHRNFAAAEEKDAQGKLRRVVRMTKDGFVLLAMGFNGKTAMRMKIAYINAFNEMADQLQKIGLSLWNQKLELEKKDATSFMWAQFGSKLMTNRKQELPDIRETRQRLTDEMEPSLFGLPELAH